MKRRRRDDDYDDLDDYEDYLDARDRRNKRNAVNMLWMAFAMVGVMFLFCLGVLAFLMASRH